jgi:uncharacterized membrane protein YhaH (DUF805 family)
MNWYLIVLQKYAVFSGRSRRKEYWWFALINFIIYLILFILFIITRSWGLLVLYYIYALAILIPGLAVTVRRLHDTAHSGWWYFISLIPIVGSIILLVLLATDSDSEENRFGPNPKTHNNIEEVDNN